MHPFSVLTLGIFVAGYITARWDLVTRLYELAIFAWDRGVVVCVATFICDLSPTDHSPLQRLERPKASACSQSASSSSLSPSFA